MKHYYYSENDKQVGPFTFEELREKRLKKSTLVWTDELPEWTRADNVDELKDILVSEPPPLPKKELQKQPSPPVRGKKHDVANIKEIDATYAGIGILIITIIVLLIFNSIKNDIENYKIARNAFMLGSFIIRIIVVNWVSKIAKRQNRNWNVWGFFAFLWPGPVLIIIGQLRKRR
jgi:hypothetical protein